MQDHMQPGGLPRMGVQGRREFLAAAGFLPVLAAFSRGPRAMAGRPKFRGAARFFFTSQGKTALVNADGSGLRYFHFDKPGQATWQPAAIFPDGRRVIFLSMEPRRRPRAAVRRVLHADPDAPLDSRPRDRLPGRDLHQGSPGAVRDAGPPPESIRPAPRASRAEERRPDLQHPPRRVRPARVHARRRGTPLRPEPQPRRPTGRVPPRGPAGLPGLDQRRRRRRTASASPQSRVTSTSARAGRRTAAGSSTSTANPARTRGTTGPTSASVALMAASTGCSRAASPCGSRRPTATRRRGAAGRTCPHGPATAPSSSLAACRVPRSPGNIQPQRPMSTTSTATSSPSSPGAARRSAGSTRATGASPS